jgi:hypothetical protein
MLASWACVAMWSWCGIIINEWETVAMPSMLLHLHHAWMHSGIPINQRRTDTYAALNKWDFRVHFCMIQMQHHRLRYHHAI